MIFAGAISSALHPAAAIAAVTGTEIETGIGTVTAIGIGIETETEIEIATETETEIEIGTAIETGIETGIGITTGLGVNAHGAASAAPYIYIPYRNLHII